MSASIFETERLRLRPFTVQDEPWLFDVFADSYTRTFYPEMNDPANVRRWIEWNLRNYEMYGYGLLALESKDTSLPIGDCGLTYQDVEGTKELEIGYHIIFHERRKGYALEAARGALEYGFSHTARGLICSIVRRENVDSRAVASRLHSECTEILKRGIPTLFYFTTRNEWERRSSAI